MVDVFYLNSELLQSRSSYRFSIGPQTGVIIIFMFIYLKLIKTEITEYFTTH